MMTITDNTAVILRQFGYRPESGGAGQYYGGNGVIRDTEFLEPIQVSLLTERRSRAPYGLAGGDPGSMGKNVWVKQLDDGKTTRNINLGGKAAVHFKAGDRLIINTPGGGGWGDVKHRKEMMLAHKKEWAARGSLAEKASAEAAFGA
jgi:5-oxoprolinase (ATP-hydrolysing)